MKQRAFLLTSLCVISAHSFAQGTFAGGPSDQRAFNQIVSDGTASVEGVENDALVKKRWIEASRRLCSSPEAAVFSQKKDWVGYVRDVNMADNGDVRLDLQINEMGNRVKTINLPRQFEDTALMLRKGGFFSPLSGDKVVFSGFFRRGNTNENECLDTWSIFSSPKLVRENFVFEFSSLRPAQ